MVLIGLLIARYERVGNNFLSLSQELGTVDGIRNGEEDHESQETGRDAFNDEQQLPRGNASSNLTDSVSQSTAIRVCHCCAANEDAMSKADFPSRVEIGQVKWNAWSEHRFGNAQKESACHQSAPAESGGLDGGNEAPEEHDKSYPDVRRELLEPGDRPLKEDVYHVIISGISSRTTFSP